MVIVVIMDMVSFDMAFLVGFIIAVMVTAPEPAPPDLAAQALSSKHLLQKTSLV